MTRNTPLISLVLPCFNEEAVIAETWHRILAWASSEPGYRFEFVFVDDGSCDDTLPRLREFFAADARVRVIVFSRNFGHQFAVTAGVDAAHGEAVVLLDADLQDPPEVVSAMLAKWREGWQVVYGVRAERDGDSRFKIWSAHAFYRVLSHLSDTPIPVDTGDFRLMDRAVVDVLKQMPERDRFLRGMVSWVGFRQFPLPYRRAARYAGTSKYPLHKMIRFATNGILSFSMRPLQLAMDIGLACAALACAGIVWVFVMRLATHNWVPGWAATIIAVLFLGGVQLVCTGILGEYVGRLYMQSKSRPLYIVRECLEAQAARRDAP